MAATTETMRAVVIDGPGDPATLRAQSRAVPTCAEGDVVVRVEAAAINRSDVLNVRGLPLTVFPRVPGRDFAGTIVDGPEREQGRAVWGTGSGDLGFTRDGSHAEFIAVPRSAVLGLPPAWTVEQAGASGLSYATAAAGLSRAPVEAGDAVLVTGAAGGVGTAACAIACWRGGRLIGAVRDEAEAETFLGRFPGCDAVITGPDLGAELARLTDGRGIDVCFDSVGTVVFADALASLGQGGRMATIAGTPGATVPFDPSAFYRRDLTLIGVNTTRYDATWMGSLLAGLESGFASGELPPIDVARTLALEDASGGYEAVWRGEPGGRVVIVP